MLDAAADTPHHPAVHRLIDWARERAVERQSRHIDPPENLADAGRIRQLLHNLLRNAEEAQPEGRARVEVSLHAASEGSRSLLELEVRDHGPGVPESLLERLFEPYTTTKVKVTGLCLAIVKKIVEEHAGHIRADNMSDGGARFRVRFPL